MLDTNKSKSKKIFKAFIGIGTNKGNRKNNIQLVLDKLTKHKKIKVLKVSNILKNPPQEGIKTGYFLNAAIKVLTTLSPQELLKLCLETERYLGRDRKAEMRLIAPKQKNRGKINKSRTIDLDILFYGNRIIKNKKLTIPHPRLHKRYFVLIPLLDLDRNLIHPKFKRTIYELSVDLNLFAGSNQH